MNYGAKRAPKIPAILSVSPIRISYDSNFPSDVTKKEKLEEWGKRKNCSVFPLVRCINPSRTIACHRATHPLGNLPSLVNAYLSSSREEAFPWTITRAPSCVHYRTRSTGSRSRFVPGGCSARSKNRGGEEKMTVSRHAKTNRQHVRHEEQRVDCVLRDSSRIVSYRGYDGNAPASEA